MRTGKQADPRKESRSEKGTVPSPVHSNMGDGGDLVLSGLQSFRFLRKWEGLHSAGGW